VALNALPTRILLQPTDAILAETGLNRAQFLEEGHSRLAGPLLAIAAPLLGFASLMLGSFSRFGLWRQMGVAVGLLIGVQLVWTWAGSVAIQSEAAWPLIYLAPLLGVAVAVFLLMWAQWPRRIRAGAAA
jgi:lipopolysaccharide export system permease protein